LPATRRHGNVLIHTGAGQSIRVWSLERYQSLVSRLRAEHYLVSVACDPDQRHWWLRAGETEVATPHTVNELLGLIDQAGVFIGNDSGPGHLAAYCGVPTFSFFGPQLPEWFAPLHPEGIYLEGKPCPYKPCSDYCRFAAPRCLLEISEPEAWSSVQKFVALHLGPRSAIELSR
jgi:ADP-heptose:LPS heptosyltransferase